MGAASSPPAPAAGCSRPEALAVIEREYLRFGVAGIFVSRFLPGFRAVVPPFAGLVGSQRRCGPWSRWASPQRHLVRRHHHPRHGDRRRMGADQAASSPGVNRTLGIVAAVVIAVAAGIWYLAARRRRRAGAGLARHPGRARPCGAVVPRGFRASPRARPGRPRPCWSWSWPMPIRRSRRAIARLVAAHLRERWGFQQRDAPARAAARGRAAHPVRRLRRAGCASGSARRSVWRWSSGCGPSRSATGRIGAHEDRLMPPAGELLGIDRAEAGRGAPAPQPATEPAMTAETCATQIDRDFWLEGFRDFLALEAGHSANTVEAYLRDLRRLGEFAAGARGARARPGHPHPPPRFRLPAQGPGAERRDHPARACPPSAPTSAFWSARAACATTPATGWRAPPRPGPARHAHRGGGRGPARGAGHRRAARLARSRAAGAGVRRRAARVRAVRPRHHRPAADRGPGPGVRQGRQGAAGPDRTERRSARYRSTCISCARRSIGDKAEAGCCSMRGASRSPGSAPGAS